MHCADPFLTFQTERFMKTIRRIITILVTMLCINFPFAQASTISYTTTYLGGVQWRYDYLIHNSKPTPLQEFTIFFNDGMYENLTSVGKVANWDVLTIQPDGALPAAGFYDGLALGGGIAFMNSLGGFAIAFDYLAGGTPGGQLFTVSDPLTLNIIEQGITVDLAAVPLPSTVWLIFAGALALAWPTRRTGLTMAAAPRQTLLNNQVRRPSVMAISRFQLLVVCAAAMLLVTACGGSDKQPVSPAAQQSTLLASAASSNAVEPLAVVKLQKIHERRVTRTVWEYTFQVSIANTGTTAAIDVAALLTSAPNGTEIVDGAVAAGTIDAGSTVTPADVIVLRQDRTIPFSPADLTWQISSAASASVELDTLEPAEVYTFSLQELGIDTTASVTSSSASVADAIIKDGTLRFSTAGDTGVDQTATITLHDLGGNTTVRALIRSTRPTSAVPDSDAQEDGSPPAGAPLLSVTGLGPNNSFSGSSVKFRLDGVSGLDLKDDSNGVIQGANNVKISLKKYWVFDSADSSFSISGSVMQQLLAALPTGALNIMLSFVSKDGAFAQSYDLLGVKSIAKLSGRLVNAQGAGITGLAGKKILLKGYNSNMRLDALVDNTGHFEFSGLISDTYQLTLNDLNAPNAVTISTVVLPDTTQVNVTMVYDAPATGGQITSQTARAASPMSSSIAGTSRQNGTGAPSRRIPGAASKSAPAKTATKIIDGVTTETYVAVSASQNDTITTPINFTVPMGTKNVGVKISVYTAEYPTYTTALSQFNDTWSYSVVGLPGVVLSASGSVNQSHFTQGTITRSACVDVTTQAKNGSFSITGSVRATNIGDSIFPTITTAEISTACAALQVIGAKFLSPDTDGHPVIEPINLANNFRACYLSIPRTAEDATHAIPLEITFSPPNAEVTEVNIGISADGDNPLFSTRNLMGQAHVISAGKIRFSALSLPTFSGGRVPGKLSVAVRIKGTIDGTDAVSDPTEGGQVTFRGNNAFTPLYLANDEAALAARRTAGLRDAGGDSWATSQTIDWLASNSFRFDDISGKHVAQFTNGRSVLGHAGHSDGQALDMRYADGMGGYTEALGGSGGGAAIKHLIDTAAAEVANPAPAPRPNLIALQAWIKANRTMIDERGAAANFRKGYFGKDFIKLALVDGKFSSAAGHNIPGVGTWEPPLQFVPAADHLHHWHLTINARP